MKEGKCSERGGKGENICRLPMVSLIQERSEAKKVSNFFDMVSLILQERSEAKEVSNFLITWSVVCIIFLVFSNRCSSNNRYKLTIRNMSSVTMSQKKGPQLMARPLRGGGWDKGRAIKE